MRGHARASLVLPPWLAAHVIGAASVLPWPGLNTWAFWITKELLYDLLYLLLDVELAARLYGHLAWVAPRAQRCAVGVLVATVGVAALSSGPVVKLLEW